MKMRAMTIAEPLSLRGERERLQKRAKTLFIGKRSSSGFNTHLTDAGFKRRLYMETILAKKAKSISIWLRDPD